MKIQAFFSAKDKKIKMSSAAFLFNALRVKACLFVKQNKREVTKVGFMTKKIHIHVW